MKITTDLDYFDGTNVVPEGSFRISASGISKFFTKTTDWYKENLLGADGFTGSTSSVLGSIVHYVAEMYAKHSEFTQHNKEQIQLYIDKYCDPTSDDYNQEIDSYLIEAHYKIMGEALVNNHVAINPPTHVEEFLFHEILPNIVVGGSNDFSTFTSDGGLIGDYKTTGSLTAPTTIPYPYKLQLLVYAWLYKQRGLVADRIQIVYITRNNIGRISPTNGNPLKDYPTKITTVTEQITEQDYQYIEDKINLIADSVECWNNHPETRYLLAQDIALKLQ